MELFREVGVLGGSVNYKEAAPMKGLDLDQIEIAAPCKADWNSMSGNEQVRFCGLCKLNVYNLSAMTRADAETLVQQKEGRLCIRFFRRADGRLLTQDCPVGLAARIRQRARRIRIAAYSLIAALAAGIG